MAEDRMLNDEILLGLIKANSGGGGTTNYNSLSNKPQIAGTELQGNKSLADLGIASANDLAGKQDALTAGIYIQMDNGVISVKRDITQTAQTLYYHITIKSNDNYINVEKTQNGVKVSDTEYNWQAVTSNPANVDDCFTISTSETNWVFTNLIASTTQPAGYAKTLYKSDPLYDYSTTYVTTVDADKKLIIQSELDDAMATKQDTLTFDNTPTDGSNNPVKSNGIYDALATKADTDMVAADFNATASYTAGNYCIYDGKFYKFKNNHSGAWSEADVDEIKIAGELSALKNGLIGVSDRSRSNITTKLADLPTAVSEQNLEKYGYKIGDYFVGASGYTYILADMDTYYGGYNNNAIVNTHHISLVVKTGATSKWAETNDTSGGYKTSTLHSYLSSTVLDNIKSDMIALFGGSTGLEHLVSHKLLLTTATSAWAWSDNAEYISALSEPQVYGTNVWAIDGYQTGEAWKWLEVFHKFNFCEILGNIWWWLRSISSASYACVADNGGIASSDSASSSDGAVGLIIFH